jgi:D-amino peptidase
MEGLAGIDNRDQCYPDIEDSPAHLYGKEQLTADVNAAVAGCFDAGAAEVRVLDGHGPNNNRGFLEDKLDPRVTRVWIESLNPTRWEGMDELVDAVAMIGQHSMVGTLHGFLDHTQSSRVICRYSIDGVEYGEMGQFALYAGHYGIPLMYVSGDEALCAEAARQFPHAVSTPTKRGTGFLTCELYDVDEVRRNIRRDIAHSLEHIDRSKAWRLRPPIEIKVEWAWSEPADNAARIAGVTRVDARTASWNIASALDVYSWPNASWTPAH